MGLLSSLEWFELYGVRSGRGFLVGKRFRFLLNLGRKLENLPRIRFSKALKIDSMSRDDFFFDLQVVEVLSVVSVVSTVVLACSVFLERILITDCKLVIVSSSVGNVVLLGSEVMKFSTKAGNSFEIPLNHRHSRSSSSVKLISLY